MFFTLGLAVSGTLLVLLGYAVGNRPDPVAGGFFESVLAAATGPVTGTLLAFALLTVAAWCVRRLWLEWLAWRPGQVAVPLFTTGSQLSEASPEHLTALFRQRFASLRLQSPAPVPGGAPEADFMEVLGGRSIEGSNPLGALLALAQAAKPTHAYVVHGVLVERPIHPKYGVTIQVVRRPEEGAPPETVYDISWERAVRQAADRAMAHILPRTRRCTAPWGSWRGFVMPTELLETYESAAWFEQQRRYDQALARYFEAVERDPMNLSLRLNIGHLQEKLGLYIDALATYEGIVAVAESPRRVQVYPRSAQRERDRVLLLTRYRRAVLLGGPALGEQWRHTSRKEDWTERDDQRVDLRARLRNRLMERLEPTVRDHGLQGPFELPASYLARMLEEPEPRAQASEDPLLHDLRRIFVRHALDEMSRLQGALADLRTPHREAPLALTRTGLDLSRICTAARYRWIERQLTSPANWIWGEKELQQLVTDVQQASPNKRMLRWHEHYNAACAYALPLLVEDDSEPEIRDELARRAVEHLQQATSCTDSGYIATRRDWLLSEDPDLDGLRVHARFKAFEAMYFPAPAPTPRRPRHVQRLEVSRYTRDLLDATARRWQSEWHARRLDPALQDPHELIRWWQDEAEVWRLVGRVAWNHRRWRARYALLEKMDELSVDYGGEPLEVAFRALAEPWMCNRSEAKVDALANDALEDATARLRELTRSLCPEPHASGEFAVQGIDRWIEELRDKNAGGELLRARDIKRLCDRHAAVWESLHLWLTVDKQLRDSAAGRFREQMDKLSSQLEDAASGSRSRSSRSDQKPRSRPYAHA